MIKPDDADLPALRCVGNQGRAETGAPRHARRVAPPGEANVEPGDRKRALFSHAPRRSEAEADAGAAADAVALAAEVQLAADESLQPAG